MEFSRGYPDEAKSPELCRYRRRGERVEREVARASWGVMLARYWASVCLMVERWCLLSLLTTVRADWSDLVDFRDRSSPEASPASWRVGR